jgi:hypothetical protein
VWIPYTSLSKNGKKIVENILQNIYVWEHLTSSNA